MPNPLVSVIIPVYNGERFLREALDSALAQTYGPIEIIAVDDGSTDNSEKILKRYDRQIPYLRQENAGPQSMPRIRDLEVYKGIHRLAPGKSSQAIWLLGEAMKNNVEAGMSTLGVPAIVPLYNQRATIVEAT